MIMHSWTHMNYLAYSGDNICSYCHFWINPVIWIAIYTETCHCWFFHPLLNAKTNAHTSSQKDYYTINHEPRSGKGDGPTNMDIKRIQRVAGSESKAETHIWLHAYIIFICILFKISLMLFCCRIMYYVTWMCHLNYHWNYFKIWQSFMIIFESFNSTM